jgi:hypothetical protein
MYIDQLIATILCIWFGFAVAHQVHSQSTQDKILTNQFGNSGWWRLALVRFIYFVIGVLGVLGFAWLSGNVSIFKGLVVPVGVIIGIVFFFLTIFLSKG